MPAKSLRWIVIGILTVVLIHAVAGPRGFYALYKLYNVCKATEVAIANEKENIDSLKEVNERINTDLEYIERSARELLGVSRPGETVIKFVDIQK